MDTTPAPTPRQLKLLRRLVGELRNCDAHLDAGSLERRMARLANPQQASELIDKATRILKEFQDV